MFSIYAYWHLVIKKMTSLTKGFVVIQNMIKVFFCQR